MNAKTFAIGMSSAASWAWGTSLIMGQQIAQQKGVEAFMIWAIANALALALFGFVHYKGYIKPEIYRSKFVKSIALVIQLFCLVVQLNFINQIVDDLIHDPTASYLITFAVGCVFVLAMYGKGLRASIFTDVLQWAIAIVTIFVILGVALYNNVPHYVMATTGTNEYVWAIWSAIILLCGPIGDVQHWQRAENDETKKGYYLGALLFGMYMVLIFVMANFHFNNVMNAILLVTVLCVTTSTIDSIAVATHEMGGKKKSRKGQKVEEDGNDYKKMTMDLFDHPEKFVSPAAKGNYSRMRRVALMYSSIMKPKEWKTMYNALVGGDPKSRTMRSLIVHILDNEAKTSE